MEEQPFVEIDHTADLAIRVWGHTLAELFIHAAQGMFTLMRFEPCKATERVTRSISLEAYDIEMLLVDWLDELLYQATRDAILFDSFEIRSLKQSALEAVVHGKRPCYPQKVIKAVTYAGVAIRETANGYETIVTFDV